MLKSKFNPDDVMGKPYERGMLPFGGSVTKGKISSVITEEEFNETMKRLKAIVS